MAFALSPRPNGAIENYWHSSLDSDRRAGQLGEPQIAYAEQIAHLINVAWFDDPRADRFRPLPATSRRLSSQRDHASMLSLASAVPEQHIAAGAAEFFCTVSIADCRGVAA